MSSLVINTCTKFHKISYAFNSNAEELCPEQTHRSRITRAARQLICQPALALRRIIIEQQMCSAVREVLTARQSPWQNPYAERLTGSIRRECLDHVIVLNETGLRRILKSYFDYYERSRTHLSLGKDAPLERDIQPQWTGPIVAIPQVGGLHHRYERIAA